MTNRISFILIATLVVFKIIAIGFTDFTLYGDEAQYWLWSKSPELGYYSKPPLLAWFLSGYTGVFGDSFSSLKIFPILVYFLISISVYRFCLRLSLSKKSSTLCGLSFVLIPAASLSSFLISTDLLLLLFWTLAMTKVLDIRKNELGLDFLLLGLFLGMAFLAKYAAIYFVISLLCLIIIDKKTLTVFKKNPLGVLFFLLSLTIVLTPNIYWNLNNGWVTFSHTSDNASLQNLSLGFYEPIKFLSEQIIMVGPVLFFSFVLLIKYFSFDFENKFLLIFSLPTIIIILLESFLVRANANWAAPALISFFVLFYRLVNNKKTNLIIINFVFNYIIALILFGAVLLSSKHVVFDRIRDFRIFSQEISGIINDADLVVSDRMIFSKLTYEFRNQENNLYMPYREGSRVTNHFQISFALNKNTEGGFYLIGELGDVSYLTKNYEGRFIKEFVVPFNSTSLKLYEISIN